MYIGIPNKVPLINLTNQEYYSSLFVNLCYCYLIKIKLLIVIAC